MLFGDGVGFSGLFATHPPLLERIQALEPQFRADSSRHCSDAGSPRRRTVWRRTCSWA